MCMQETQCNVLEDWLQTWKTRTNGHPLSMLASIKVPGTVPGRPHNSPTRLGEQGCLPFSNNQDFSSPRPSRSPSPGGAMRLDLDL